MKLPCFWQGVSLRRPEFLRHKPSLFFLAVFVSFGILFGVITPPIYNPDESVHWYRSYEISQRHFVPENLDGVLEGESGGHVPVGVINFVASNLKGAGYKHSPAQILDESSIKLEPNKQVMAEFTNVAIYPPVNYLPQAAGISLARLFTDHVMPMFYMARLANIVFLGLAIALALYLLPYGGRALMALGLLPMVVAIGASLSADAFLLASVSVYIAYLLKLMKQRTSATRKQWLYIAVLATLVSLSKQTYFIFAITLFALPLSRSVIRRKELLKALAALILALLPLVLWLAILAGLNTQPHRLQESVGIYPNPQDQRSFVLHNPLAFLKIIAASLGNGSIIYSFVGVLGVSDVMLPACAYFLIAITLFLSFGENTAAKGFLMSQRNKILFAGTALLNVLLILGGLYVYWTNPYQKYILGVQGRYMLPVVIVAIPLLYGRYRHTVRDRYIRGGLVLGLMLSVCALVSTYYRLSFV